MKNKTFNECLAEGLLIFNKYWNSEHINLRASDGVIYCYLHNGVISEQDQLMLVELGWHYIAEKENWDWCGWWQYSI